MTLRTPPLYLQAGSHSAENDRLGISGLVGTAGVGPGAAELQVTQSATPAMTVAVAAGHVWVAGTTSSTQGTYHTYNDAAVTLTVTTAHASLPRIDLVCVTIRDAAYAGSSNDCILQVIAGTPAASPTAPALPASSLSLATVAVAAGASSIVNANITDTRTRAAANLGGAWGTIGGTLSNQTDLNNALAAKAALADLKILQVVSGSHATAVSTTSTTFVDTGLSLSITPTSASSKILVLVSQPIYMDRAANLVEGAVQLVRGSTGLLSSGTRDLSIWVVGGTTVNLGSYYAATHLDSPATASAVTYKTQMRLSPTYGGSMIAQRDSARASIVLLEVKA